jgi:Major capsid protein 13-like
MSTSTSANFKIYHEQFFGGMVEVMEQNSVAFNEAGRNTIQMVPEHLKGDFEQESFFQLLGAGLVSRRDTTSTADATPLGLAQDEFVGVKLNRRLGPVENTFDSFKKIGRSEEEMSFILGQQAGQAVTLEMLNTSVSVLIASTAGVGAMVVDRTGDDPNTIIHEYLVDLLAAYGDQGGNVLAWLMHSKTFYDLMKQSIADKLFEVAGVTVISGTVASLNRPIIVTDSAALLSSGTYSVLGLTEGACVINDSENRDIVSDVITGKDNLILRIQGEYAYNIKVKGYKWDITNGGSNPNAGALTTSSNWDKVVNDNKNLAASMLKVK